METSRTSTFPPLGRQPRGVQGPDVDRVADALLRSGERPTVEKIRQKLGTGSPNTINPLLDQWWQRLSQRLEAGPQALERLPEEVIHAAESLWLLCLDQARARAHLELGGLKGAMDAKQGDQDLRAEVLRLREQELNERLADREKTIAILEAETKAFASLFRKEQAKSAAEAQRIVSLQTELDSMRKLLASLSVRTTLRKPSMQRTASNPLKKIAAKTKTKTIKRRSLLGVPRKKLQRPLARGRAKRKTRPRS